MQFLSFIITSYPESKRYLPFLPLLYNTHRQRAPALAGALCCSYKQITPHFQQGEFTKSSWEGHDFEMFTHYHNHCTQKKKHLPFLPLLFSTHTGKGPRLWPGPFAAYLRSCGAAGPVSPPALPPRCPVPAGSSSACGQPRRPACLPEPAAPPPE